MVLIKSNHSLTFFAFKRPLSSRERAVKPSNNPLPFLCLFGSRFFRLVFTGGGRGGCRFLG